MESFRFFLFWKFTAFHDFQKQVLFWLLMHHYSQSGAFLVLLEMTSFHNSRRNAFLQFVKSMKYDRYPDAFWIRRKQLYFTILSKTCFFDLENSNRFFLLRRVAPKMTKKVIYITLTILVKNGKLKWFTKKRSKNK